MSDNPHDAKVFRETNNFGDYELIVRPRNSGSVRFTITRGESVSMSQRIPAQLLDFNLDRHDVDALADFIRQFGPLVGEVDER